MCDGSRLLRSPVVAFVGVTDQRKKRGEKKSRGAIVLKVVNVEALAAHGRVANAIIVYIVLFIYFTFFIFF